MRILLLIYPNQIGSRIIRQRYFLSKRCKKYRYNGLLLSFSKKLWKKITRIKFGFLFGLGIVIFPMFVLAQNNYAQKVVKFRADKNIAFKDSLKSPLKNNQINEFRGLNYFKPNEKYKVNAKFIQEIGKNFEMTTSSGIMKIFRQYGKLYFEIDGKEFVLPIYQNLKLIMNPMYRNYIFIPFTDLTNGKETYGGGRYIEAKIPTSDTFELDFNYSYNPYCHYTEGYSCPVPPKENFLGIRIEAGEKVLESNK